MSTNMPSALAPEAPRAAAPATGRTAAIDPGAAQASACKAIDIGDVIIDRMIGQGKFSEVFLGHFAGEAVAIKTVHDNTAWREVELLRKVSHASIITMLDAILMNTTIHIIMELCSGGTLFDRLHFLKPSAIPLSWPQRMRICTSVASAMEYLHGLDPPIIHRDLKSLNLLLAEPVKNAVDMPIIKVADLGLGRMLKTRRQAMTQDSATGSTSDQTLLTMQVGTVQWMAPELITSSSYTGKVDVYSFGIVLYEIAWQRLPFNEHAISHQALLQWIATGLRPDISTLPAGCPDELAALMKVCWAGNPAQRPDFKKVYPWLKMVASEKGYNTWNVSL